MSYHKVQRNHAVKIKFNGLPIINTIIIWPFLWGIRIHFTKSTLYAKEKASQPLSILRERDGGGYCMTEILF